MESQRKHTAVIFDLDGTLADITHRRHLIPGAFTTDEIERSRMWKVFNSHCPGDTPIKPMVKMAQILKDAGHHEIIILTGRSDKYKEQTVAWLTEHGVPYDHLFMRPEEDHRPDTRLKWEIYRDKIRVRWDVDFVFEDRATVVEMWRSEKLLCLQCDKGDF